MTPEDCRLLIPEYLSGRLTPVEKEFFEREIENDPGLRREVYELRSLWEGLALLPEERPSAAMRAQFYKKLNALQRGARLVEKRPWWTLAWPRQLAAAALLFAVGLYAGRESVDARVHKDEIAEMRSQVQGLQEMVALSLLDRQSANSRLEGVAWGSRVERPNNELLAALVLALNHDPNVNVRLSSIDALEKFAHEAAVSQALVDAIGRQDSPLVQVALIDSLVHIRNRGAAVELKKLTSDTETNPEVRQRAQWGLEKLTYQ
jgi:anti-sigma factor RsiW